MGFFVYRHLGLLGCNIGYMKRFIPLFILTVLLFGQDKKDIIELTDGSIYQGEFVEVKNGNVYFTPEGYFGVQPIEINNVVKLELSNGLVLIRDGIDYSDFSKSGSGFDLTNLGLWLIGASGIMLLSLNNPEISERLQPDDWNLPRIKKSEANVAYLMLAVGVIFIALDGN